MNSPDGFITCSEAAKSLGVNQDAMRRAAERLGWERNAYAPGRVAFDIDEVQSWAWGLEPEQRPVCLRCQTKSAMRGRWFCAPCIQIRKNEGIGWIGEHTTAFTKDGKVHRAASS